MNEAENDTPGLVRLSDWLGLAEEARACARHCKEGAWAPNVLQNEHGVRLKSAQVLEAAADEIERLRGALLLMRGRLLMENPHAVTTEADALLLGPNV